LKGIYKKLSMKSINIQFPIKDDPATNNLFLLNYITKDALVSDLQLLLYTKKGQRYYMPDYGTNIEKFLFDPETKDTENKIIADIRESVRTYMPEVTINSVAFYTNQDVGYNDLQDNELRISIDFTYSSDVFSDSGTIVLSF